jgi:hypothetical protein
MKVVLRVIVVVALAAVAFWWWMITHPSPEKIIRGQLAALAGNISFSPDESVIVKMTHAQNAGEFFADNVSVNIDVPNHEQQTIAGREQVMQAAVASRQQVSGLDVKFPDVNVTVAADKNSATADVTLQATVSGEHDTIIQEVKFTFENVNGKWLISRVETVRAVS